MIALVEGARRQKTPNEIALTILLAALTFIFLLVCVTLRPFGIYSGTLFSVPVLIALLVCLIPTTIGGLLSAIGIAGMDRVLQRNVLAMNKAGVFQAGLLLAVVWLLVRPFGAYLERVFERKKTSLDPLLLPVERLILRIVCIDPGRETDWKRYASAFAVFGAVNIILVFFALRCQVWLPWFFPKVMSNHWQGAVTYTLSGLWDALGKPLQGVPGSTPQVVTFELAPDLNGEYGLSSSDLRHRAVMSALSPLLTTGTNSSRSTAKPTARTTLM